MDGSSRIPTLTWFEASGLSMARSRGIMAFFSRSTWAESTVFCEAVGAFAAGAGAGDEVRPDAGVVEAVSIAQPLRKAAATRAPATIARALIAGPGCGGPGGWRPDPPAASRSP